MNHTVVDRHRADHGRALRRQFFPEGLRIPVGRKVHDSLRSHIHRRHDLLHLHIIILAVPGDSQIHIDLCPQHGADSVGVDAFVQPVGTDRHLPPRHKLPDLLLCPVFFFCNRLHLRSNHPPLCGIHLCRILSHNPPFLSDKYLQFVFSVDIQNP